MAEWIIRFIDQHGYLGITALMCLENIFPPLPSELIMPFAGFAAARGQLHPLGAVLAGVLGSVLGTLPWYWAGRRLGSQRLKAWARCHGRWLAVSAEDIEHGERWFARHGARSVMLGRLVPALRSVISAPAGVAAMAPGPFLLWSSLGTALWTALLAALGYLLEDRYAEVGHWLEPLTRIFVVGCVLAYLYRVLTFGRRR